MIDYFGIENILWVLIIGFLFMGFSLDKFSRHTLNYIDKLQSRVDELEKHLGIKDD